MCVVYICVYLCFYVYVFLCVCVSMCSCYMGCLYVCLCICLDFCVFVNEREVICVVCVCVHECKLCVYVYGGIGCVLKKVSVHICVYMYCVFV